MFKNMWLAIPFDMLLNPSFKMATSFANVSQCETWSFTTTLFTLVETKKTFFIEIEYDKLYPSGSTPAHIYGNPKMHKFSSSDSFPKLRPIVSSIGNFNHSLTCFLCDLLSPLVHIDRQTDRRTDRQIDRQLCLYESIWLKYLCNYCLITHLDFIYLWSNCLAKYFFICLIDFQRL